MLGLLPLVCLNKYEGEYDLKFVATGYSVYSSQCNQQLMGQTEAQRNVLFIYLCSEEELQLLRVPNMCSVFSNLPVERLCGVTKEELSVIMIYSVSYLTQAGTLCAGSNSPLRHQAQSPPDKWLPLGTDRNERSSSLFCFPLLTLHCALLRTGCIFWDEQGRSFINIPQCPQKWCTCNHVMGERSRTQDLCSQQTQFTILWALSGADFEAQAYEKADSFILWFSNLAGSLPREI